MRYITTIDGEEFLVEIIDERHVILNGKPYLVDFQSISEQPVYSLLVDGKSYEAHVYPEEDSWQVLLKGYLFPARVEDEREKTLRASAGKGVSERAEYALKAPMPGLVIAVRVHEGQEVQMGDLLVILESMKMQNELKSPRAGIVTRLRVAAGDSVEQHQTLLTVT